MNKGVFDTGKITGLLYLGLALTGMFAFLFAKSKLYVEGDAVATSTNLATQESLARFGIAAEIALVGFQALVAVWFFKLFRKVDLFASVALAAFGTINAILILITSGFWLSALLVAAGDITQPYVAHQVLTLFQMHESLWVVGKLFFGLWLIPMGYLVTKAQMPKVLGWILIGGGSGYVLSTFLSIVASGMADINEIITIPATIGEFWMIGYLLSKKVKTNR